MPWSLIKFYTVSCQAGTLKGYQLVDDWDVFARLVPYLFVVHVCPTGLLLLLQPPAGNSPSPVAGIVNSVWRPGGWRISHALARVIFIYFALDRLAAPSIPPTFPFFYSLLLLLLLLLHVCLSYKLSAIVLMCHFLFRSPYIVKAFFISRFLSHCWPKVCHASPVDSESFDMQSVSMGHPLRIDLAELLSGGAEDRAHLIKPAEERKALLAKNFTRLSSCEHELTAN